MLEARRGDILQADAEAIVNTVNCVGYMGRGIALQFRNVYPENFKAYAAACSRGEVQPGRLFVFETGRLGNPHYILNFPTKRHWRGKSRMEDIDSGLVALVGEIRRRGIRSIAIPPLGCGLGGLKWDDVRPRIEKAMSELPNVQVFLYEPADDAGGRVGTRAPEVPRMTPGRAALIGLMRRYLAGLMDPFVSLLEVHKLMYFMQEAGERLRLDYVKAPYGPYAENLRHVLRALEGHFTSGYGDGADAPGTPLELLPRSVGEAEAFLAAHPETRQRFDRVADLVDGFETPFGLELLSTVHWVATREGAATPEKAVERTFDWNERKRRFSEDQIRLSFQVLQKKGWLAASASPVP